MTNRISVVELRRLRNQVPIDRAVEALGLPTKQIEGQIRFLCPCCQEFHTATNPDTNLARCFRCERNFNPIDLVMVVDRVSFLDAVALRGRITTDRKDKP